MFKPKSKICNIIARDAFLLTKTKRLITKSESIKLAQKDFKSKYDWMGKENHRKLFKEFKLDHTTKWYMHKQELLFENEMYKVLWDF